MSGYNQPTIQIRANSAIIYNKYSGSRTKFDANGFKLNQKREIMAFQEKTAYSGLLTNGAIKRMSKAINLFVESSVTRKVYSKMYDKKINHRLSFITLTIPAHEKVELRTAQKTLLEPLLKHLRQVHGMNSYVWKAEIQKRGQLHYHIISDVYIPHYELKNKWNQLITKQGFNNEYIAENGHNNANSTDIHSVKNIKNLANYLLKYFTKKEQNEVQMKGKLWDCSLNLKTAKYFETELTEDIEYDIYNLSEQKRISVTFKESFTFIKFMQEKAISVFPPETKRAYNQHLINIRAKLGTLFDSIEKGTFNQDSMDTKKDIPKPVPKQSQINYYSN